MKRGSFCDIVNVNKEKQRWNNTTLRHPHKTSTFEKHHHTHWRTVLAIITIVIDMLQTRIPYHKQNRKSQGQWWVQVIFVESESVQGHLKSFRVDSESFHHLVVSESIHKSCQVVGLQAQLNVNSNEISHFPLCFLLQNTKWRPTT